MSTKSKGTELHWRVAVASPLSGEDRMLLVEQWEYPKDMSPYPVQRIYIPSKDIEAFAERVRVCIELRRRLESWVGKERNITQSSELEDRVIRLETKLDRLEGKVKEREDEVEKAVVQEMYLADWQGERSKKALIALETMISASQPDNPVSQAAKMAKARIAELEVDTQALGIEVERLENENEQLEDELERWRG